MDDSPDAEPSGQGGAPDQGAPSTSFRWRSPLRTLSGKLILLLLAALAVTFALLGYVNVRLHQHHLEAATLEAAERVSDTIKRTTSYLMLRNDREAMYEIIRTVEGEPGIHRVRILDREGVISYSSDPAEINHRVDMRAEACYVCHAQAQPLARLNRPDRFRIYRSGQERVLGVITPIENQPSCSNAACHAHPASQQILGVLDITMPLARTDADLREATRKMAIYTFVAMIGISILSWLFVWRLVHRPVKALTTGTHRIAQGGLGYQIHVNSHDEVGDLADSFNMMSLRLRDANEEITSWARTLEDRVEEKTHELTQVHEHLLRSEKMASIGKLAAVVAHEVNNPLSGILTYAKLIKKWIDNGDFERRPDRLAETRQCLDLVESESRRCGDLVRNLLTFSRVAPINLSPTSLEIVVEHCLKLLQPQLEMNNIQWQIELDPELPPVQCDGAQIEQVLVALVVNAMDAMPQGGNLWLAAHWLSQRRVVELQVRDDGQGIAPDVLQRMFEPFVTTKESGKGVGLGLAICKGIIERHKGAIDVESELGKGTCFHIFLPLDAGTSIDDAAAEVRSAGTGGR